MSKDITTEFEKLKNIIYLFFDSIASFYGRKGKSDLALDLRKIIKMIKEFNITDIKQMVSNKLEELKALRYRHKEKTGEDCKENSITGGLFCNLLNEQIEFLKDLLELMV